MLANKLAPVVHGHREHIFIFPLVVDDLDRRFLLPFSHFSDQKVLRAGHLKDRAALGELNEEFSSFIFDKFNL